MKNLKLKKFDGHGKFEQRTIDVIGNVRPHEEHVQVKSVLDLIKISTRHTYKVDKECLQAMDNAAKELDKKIWSVVNLSDKANNDL